MPARVANIVRQWSDETDDVSRTKSAAQLIGVLEQSPQLVGLALRLDGGAAALVLALYNLDSSNGSLRTTRTVLHAVAELLCGSDSADAHALALRAAKPGAMLARHTERLRPLSEPDPDRLVHMSYTQRQKVVSRAVHISEMAMLLHRLVPSSPAFERLLPVILSAVPWMTAVARHCSMTYGAINTITSGPAALLTRLATEPERIVRLLPAHCVTLLPHVVSTLRMSCPDALVSAGNGGDSDIFMVAAADLLASLHAPSRTTMSAAQLSSYLMRCNALPVASAFTVRFDSHGGPWRDAVVVAAANVVTSIFESLPLGDASPLLIKTEPLLVDRLSCGLLPPPADHKASSLADLLQAAALEKQKGGGNSSPSDTMYSNDAHHRLQACCRALYIISQRCPESISNSSALPQLLRVVIALPGRVACEACVDAAWYASGCYTSVAQRCALRHAATEALQGGMLQSAVAAVEAGAAASNTRIADQLEHWILCINFFLDFVPKEGGRQAVSAGARTVLVAILNNREVSKTATVVLLRLAEETTGHKAVLFAPGLVTALLNLMEAAVAKTYQAHRDGNLCTIQQATAAAVLEGRGDDYRDPFPNIDPFSATTILLHQVVAAGAVKASDFARAQNIISAAIIVGPGQRSLAALNSIMQFASGTDGAT